MAGLFSRVLPPSELFARSSQLLSQVDRLLTEYHSLLPSSPSKSIHGRLSLLRSQLAKNRESVQQVKGSDHSSTRKATLSLLSSAIRRIDQVLGGEEEKEEEEEEGPPLSMEAEYEKERAAAPPPSHSTPPSEAQRMMEGPDRRRTKSAMYNEEEEEEGEAPSPPPQPLPSIGRVVEGNVFVALGDWAAAEEGDLSIAKGELVTIEQTRQGLPSLPPLLSCRDDGWWMGLKENGQRGLLPKTFLRHLPHDVMSEHLQRNRLITTQETKELVERGGLTVQEMARDRRATLSVEEKKTLRTLGEAQRNDKHVSLACHVTPRLSESNLTFHDLFWNHEQDMLRKRHVKVCKYVRVVRVERMSGLGEGGGLVRAALFDGSSTTGRQIVSNVHTIRVKCGRNEWTTTDKREADGDGLGYGEFILRSNYRQARVNLLIQVSTLEKDTEGVVREKSVGVVELPLLDESGKCLLSNKTYVQSLREVQTLSDASPSTSASSLRRIVLKVSDPPRDALHYVDSLPDVLLLSPLHLSPCFYFRRHAGRVLIRDRLSPMSAELINDLLLALFPKLSDESDVLDLLSRLWGPREKLLSKWSEEQRLLSFRELFSSLCLCMICRPLDPFSWLSLPPQRASRQRELSSTGTSLSSASSTAALLSSTRSAPLRSSFFCFDLHGEHAID